MKRLLTVSLVLFLAVPALADKDKKKDKEKDEFPKFEKVLEGWKPTEGFFKLYRKEKEEGLLVAVPADLLGKPFFLATSVSGGSNFAGWQWQDSGQPRRSPWLRSCVARTPIGCWRRWISRPLALTTRSSSTSVSC